MNTINKTIKMKKLLLLLVLFAGTLNAQIVNIPDANFKAKLISNGVDQNGDGQIQFSEAQFTQILHLDNANINDLTGIEFFGNLQELTFSYNNILFFPTLSCNGLKVLVCRQNNMSSLDLTFIPNLEVLDCSENQIGSLDLSSLVNLKTLRCSNNVFSTLNLTGLSNLINLDITSNYFATIDLSGLSSLQNFDCNFNQLIAINFEGLTSLNNISIDNNQLNSISLTGLTNLNYLSCKNNLLSTLDTQNSSFLNGLYCGNNQLTSLDVSSNTALTYLNCSNNQLPSLNVSGLINLGNLDCSNNQLPSLEVSSNTALTGLDCSYNLLTALNLSGLISLNYFQCNNNSIPTLDVSSNTALIDLDCSSNLLTTLNVSGLNSLQGINCGFNQITSLDVSGLTNLERLYCNYNQLSSLNLSGLTNLERLSCYFNQLSSLNLSGLNSLKGLYCYHNQLTSLNLSGLNNFFELLCSENLLTSLDVSSNTALTFLDCSNNLLTTLNVSGLSSLNFFICANNLLTTLDVSSNIALTGLGCDSNLLTTLDVSSNTALIGLGCGSNLLTTLFIKNGSVEVDMAFSNNPNLFYICADEAQVSNVQMQAEPNVVVNSYCSFTPGGNFNSILGNIKFDENNNGCDACDSALPNIRININDGTNQGASFTSASGNYTFYTEAGSFVLTPDVENPTWFAFSPQTATIPFADNNNNTATQDFCITAIGIHNDLEVVISPITPARPGFDAVYKIVYHNKGNQMLSGELGFGYDDAVLDFVSASVVPSAQNMGNLSWSYVNLLPFESRNVVVTLNVNSPTATPAVNIGDVLNFVAVISPSVGDEIPADNTFVYHQTVVGSFDPNDIICIEGTSVLPSTIGNYLHYAINFENTGNYPAENIVVKTVIDPAQFDINSLQLLNTSNAVDARISGNVVSFIFKNIQLPGGGHGHILLKVKSKSTLVTGDFVSKRADIFFDYNAPVDTGLANTTFEILSNAVVALDASVSVFPNPAKDHIEIRSASKLKSIELFDVRGRVLATKIVGVLQTDFDVSIYPNGVYFVKIVTEKGSKIEKIIKE